MKINSEWRVFYNIDAIFSLVSETVIKGYSNGQRLFQMAFEVECVWHHEAS